VQTGGDDFGVHGEPFAGECADFEYDRVLAAARMTVARRLRAGGVRGLEILGEIGARETVDAGIDALADAGAEVDEVPAGFCDEPAAQDGTAGRRRFAWRGRVEVEGGVGRLDHVTRKGKGSGGIREEPLMDADGR
jgi:hypothetical protein